MSVQGGPEQSGALSQALLGNTGVGYRGPKEEHDESN